MDPSIGLGVYLRERFWAWVLVSRAMIAASASFLLAGVLMAAIGGRYLYYHGVLMILGIRSFYFGVMWIQLPGYTGYIPHRLLSMCILSAELWGLALAVLGIDTWQYVLALTTIALGSIYVLKGMGVSWQKLPNAIAVEGMIHAGVSYLVGMEPIYGVSFPLLSALSLMVRVEPPMLGYRLSRKALLLYIAISAFLLASTLYIGLWAILAIPGAVILVLPRLSARGLYGVGSTIAKIIGVIGIISIPAAPWLDIGHLILIGFLGIIMGSLCAPLIVPGIMGRSYKEFPKTLPSIIALIAVARASYIGIPSRAIVEVLCLAMAFLIIAYLYRIISSEKAL